MLISTRQINNAELISFIAIASSGSAFSGNLLAYANTSGTFGPNVVDTYTNQLITGTKTFLLAPVVPYSGDTGRAPSAGWVIDKDLSLSGFFGLAFVSKSATETISGDKSFHQPITINSPTATGHAVNLGYLTGVSGVLSAQDVSISGVLATANLSISGVLASRLATTGASLSAITITGSSLVQSVDVTGLGGTLVIWSGGKMFISGAAGGGSSNTSVTGSSAISTPNFTGVGDVRVTYNGTYVLVSGIAGADSLLSGYLESIFVHRTAVDEIISGVKYFTGNPQAPSPTLPSGLVNLFTLSGTSGVLIAKDAATSGVLYAQMTGMSGVLSSGAGGTSTVINNYHITGTGIVTTNSNASGTLTNTFSIYQGTGVLNVDSTGTTVNNTYNISSDVTTLISSGNVTNYINNSGTLNINISGVTGNYVNMSFFFDSSALFTGQNVLEEFVGRSFFFTGYALGVYNSGTQGNISGIFYQRTPTNVKTTFANYLLNAGAFFTGVGGLLVEITGMNRIGLDILSVGTGFTGCTIGLFGVGS